MKKKTSLIQNKKKKIFGTKIGFFGGEAACGNYCKRLNGTVLMFAGGVPGQQWKCVNLGG